LIAPTSGEVQIFGHSLRKRRLEALAKVGFLVESATAYPNLTVRENLELQRRLTGAPRQSVGEVIELLGLAEYTERTSDHLSLGNKQRLSIARALVHSPELLILDEPANGLDPAGIVEIRGLLRSLAAKGRTIFLSSHILPEIGQVADRIGIIHEGRLLEELDRRELDRPNRLYLELAVDQPERAEALLRDRLGFAGISRWGERELRIADPEARAPEVARLLVGAGIGLERLVEVEEDLEERFMRLTGGRE